MKDFRSIFGVHVLISGRLVAFFGVSGILSYSSSNDGVIWSTPQNVPNNISMSIIMALDVRADVLTVFTGEPTVTTRQYSWVANAWVAGLVVSGGVDSAYGLDARWQAAGYYAINYRGVASGTWLHTQETTGNGFAGPDSALDGYLPIIELTPLNLGGGSVQAASVTGLVWNAGSLTWVLGWQAGTASLVLVSKMASYSATPPIETVTAMPTEQQWDAVIELDGVTLTIVYLLGTTLYAKRRTGIDLYSGPVQLAQNVSGSFFLVQDPATGYLSVVYQTNVNGGVDEIYMVTRQGIWGQPVLIAGSDGNAYRDPVGAHDAAGGLVHILYTTNDTTVDYGPGTLGGKPSPPTLLAPLGTTTNLSPEFESIYNQLMTSDPLAGGEIQVVRLPDGVTMWDSGATVLLPESTPYAGAALARDINYQWRRRDKDTLSSSGAGTFSGWSGYVTFIVRQGGTVTIEAINHDGINTDTQWSPLSMALWASNIQRSSPLSIGTTYQFSRSSALSAVLVAQPKLNSPLSLQLTGSTSRTSSASVALVQQGIARQTPTSISLVGSNPRSIASSIALVGTASLHSPLSSAIVSTSSRSIASSVALVATNSRTTPTSVALVNTLTPSSPTSVALVNTLTPSSPISILLA